MKKLLNLFILLLIIFSADAQSIQVKNIQKVPLTNKAFFPSFGNNQNQLFVTGQNYMGLQLINLKSFETEEISDKMGAGKNPQTNTEGNIAYTTTEFINGKKKVTQHIYKPAKISLTTNKATTEPTTTVKVDREKIIVTNHKKENIISPLGETFYIWASISPDQKKLLFTAVGKGTFITNLDGSNPVELGYLNTPSWLNNNWVIGMNDKDNGEFITASDVIAVNVNNLEKTNLTKSQNSIAIYPKASPEGSRIAFNSPNGEVFIIDIELIHDKQ